jgi:hypothetical protein
VQSLPLSGEGGHAETSLLAFSSSSLLIVFLANLGERLFGPKSEPVILDCYDHTMNECGDGTAGEPWNEIIDCNGMTKTQTRKKGPTTFGCVRQSM